MRSRSVKFDDEVLKWYLYIGRKPRQLVNKCGMVSVEKWQCEHVGSPSLSSRCLCIILEWPILKCVRMTSILRGVTDSQIKICGLILCNILFSWQFHSLCHLFLMKFLTAYFRSEYGTQQFKVLRAWMLYQQLRYL